VKKKLIIFLSEIKIRKYDILRFDLEELQSVYGYKIEIHELIEHIYPGFSFMFTNTYEDKRIKRFNYFNEWKERILFLKKNLNENIFILNQVSLHDFKGLKINYFLKKNNFKTLTFRNITFSTYQLDRNLKDFFSTVKNKSLTLNKIKNFVKKKSYYLLEKN